MMLLSVALLVSLALSGVKAECRRNGVPCLDYTVLHAYEGYEEREYPPIVWVSASAEAMRKMDVSRSLIKSLYEYLGGGNEKGENLQMVVPVRTMKVVNGEANTYTMSIALLPEQSHDPPAPLNPNVTVSREPRTVYITRAFGGQARQDDVWDKQADILKNFVADDESVETSFYYMSVYDSPWRQTDRLNEVWMVLTIIGIAKGCTYKQAECPDYTVVSIHSDYEVRRYPSITWATTAELSSTRREGQHAAFMRLFRYISGENDREQKMKMTVPVRMQNTRFGNTSMTLYEMSFMVPSEFASNAPVPNDEQIEIDSEVPTLYAVREFSGYVWSQETWNAEAQKLADSVKDDDTVDRSSYYQVGYDAPFDIFDTRRNEVWMVKNETFENNNEV